MASHSVLRVPLGPIHLSPVVNNGVYGAMDAKLDNFFQKMESGLVELENKLKNDFSSKLEAGIASLEILLKEKNDDSNMLNN